MIYLVTNQTELFDNDLYKIISVEESLQLLNSFGDSIQFDTETSGRDSHINELLCIQFGNIDKTIQIVIDTNSIPIENYKIILESKELIVQNGKFDLQFCYKHNIIPTKIWDTMIIEQLLHLGYDRKYFHVGLKDILLRRFNINMDKSVRGEIIWRGLDSKVILYAANDVVYLNDIKKQQILDCTNNQCLNAAKIENNFVPVIAYLEWCGIKLDEDKWKTKMKNDQNNLNTSEKALNEWVLNNKTKFNLEKFIFQDLQLDLFSGSIPAPTCVINWSSSKQVIPLFKKLGFNTEVKDKKTGETKDSILEKVIKTQKGINDEFLDIYFKYQEYAKVCSTYGQNYLDAINPITGRIHTTFWQLGADSGRMSCGQKDPNKDLSLYKKLPIDACKYVQLQNLPADEETRASFISEKGNLMTSCDFSALESRLGADIYNEESMIKEYLEGSGDMHSLCAYMIFKNEIPRDTPIKDIKTLFPKLRKKAKPIEFSQQFGGSEYAIMSALGCSIEEARIFKKAYDSGFPGIADFKVKGLQFAKDNGYIIMCQATGHKLYWENWEKWKQEETLPREQQSKDHWSEVSKIGRLALNSPTQGSGIVILKLAMNTFFRWIVANNYFNKILLCDLIHDKWLCRV